MGTKGREDMAFILATGYGRNSLEEFADSQMSELSCHGKGAGFLFPEVRTVIDIGGQDVKVMRVEKISLPSSSMMHLEAVEPMSIPRV